MIAKVDILSIVNEAVDAYAREKRRSQADFGHGLDTQNTLMSTRKPVVTLGLDTFGHFGHPNEGHTQSVTHTTNGITDDKENVVSATHDPSILSVQNVQNVQSRSDSGFARGHSKKPMSGDVQNVQSGSDIHSQDTPSNFPTQPWAQPGVEAPATDDADAWFEHYRQCIDRRIGIPGRDTETALRLAYRDVVTHWHFAHAGPDPNRCAGCDEPVCGEKKILFSDGAVVHFEDYRCWSAYGARWRGKAEAALAAMGIEPPHVADHLAGKGNHNAR